MDETVIVDADGDALDDFPGGRPGLRAFGDSMAESGGFGGQPLAPFFGRQWVLFLQPSDSQ